MAKTVFPDGPPTRVGARVGDQLPGCGPRSRARGAASTRPRRTRSGHRCRHDRCDVGPALGRTHRPVRRHGHAPNGSATATPAVHRSVPSGRATDGSAWPHPRTPVDQVGAITRWPGLDEKWHDIRRGPLNGVELNELVSAFTTRAAHHKTWSARSRPSVCPCPPESAVVGPLRSHVAHRGSLERLRHPRSRRTNRLPRHDVAYPLLARRDHDNAGEPLGASTGGIA